MTEPITNEEQDTGTAEAAETDAAEASDRGTAEELREGEPGEGAPATESGPRSGAPGAGDVREPVDGGDTELVALREEFEDLNDRHLRLVAEFNNFRRRSEQERLSAWARAQADLVSDLLDVLDDIQRVADLDLSNATVEAIMEGIDLVERKFLRQLREAGVEVIDPVGEPFDPERMEAMMRVPAEEDDQVDTVAQVFQKGYSLKDILVRPARVSVYTRG
ncbi:MAG: nucleotide exchange factor GrpE [Longimicrobiales bacterium]|nr:nucleotide exchange factor GrpE [Longimicrobiales bacterium]